MKERGLLPKEYFYLDKEGINSLYAQIVSEVETTRKTTSQTVVGAKLSAKLILKRALFNFLGIPEVEGGAELQGSQQRGIEITTMFTVEHILPKLITYLCDIEDIQVFDSIPRATRSMRKVARQAYILTVEKFDAPQFFGSNFPSGADAVNACGALILEQNLGADSYNYHDDYYKNIYGVMMMASITKFTRVASYSSSISHDAIYFSAHQGKSIPLGVFGSIWRMPGLFQIKPFALWRASDLQEIKVFDPLSITKNDNDPGNFGEL